MSSVQEKLWNYSEMPPPSAWQGITDALEDTPAYAQKLYRYEPKPPAAVWGKLNQQLSTPTPVVPLRTNIFKYAIAAAVLIVIAGASIFYLTNSNAPDLASQPQTDNTSTEKNTASDLQPQSGSNSVLWQKEAGANEDDNGLVSESDNPEGTIVHFSSRIHIAKKQRMPAHRITVLPEEKNIIDTERADRYMIATTADGTAVRLPKKAYSDYACAEAYNSYPCKEKIASIQSKMAASVATDFTDFVDLMKKLQDN